MMLFTHYYIPILCSHYAYNLSEKQMQMIENLKKDISISVDKKTDVITLSFTDQDPLIAATMVDTIMCRLQNQITAYRSQ